MSLIAHVPILGHMLTDIALQTIGLSKRYKLQTDQLVALDNVSITIKKAQFVVIMGPSGSGKSTFLQCAAGLDRGDSGKILLGETDLMQLTEEKLTDVRRRRIGFVFQAFNLLPMLTVYENIVLPLRLSGQPRKKAEVMHILREVGLEAKADQMPAELSGGQQQRVAIARTLCAQPEVLFADEPTGSLDSVSGKQILGLLRDAVDTHKQTVIMVTHDPVAAAWGDEVLFLVDGKVTAKLQQPTVEKITDELGKWGDVRR